MSSRRLFYKLLLSGIVLFSGMMPANAIAPRSQADGSFLYQFDVKSFLRDGYCLYTEPGREQMLAFFLGEIAEPNSDYRYYVIDVFDIHSREKIGFIDFNMLTNRQTGKTSTSFTTALEWVKPRTYRDAALKAAAEYGLVLGNTPQGVHDMLDFRRTAPVDPPPAIYILKEFQKSGRLGWKHIGDIMVCFMIECSIRLNSDYISIDPEEGLARRNFYERRYGALRKKGWYLELNPEAYAKLGRVALGGMVFDFSNGLFRPLESGEVFPDAVDVFIESLPPFDADQASQIDGNTQTHRFPDRHVWSLIKAISALASDQSQDPMREWVIKSFQIRGREPILIPLAMDKIPENWRPAVMTAQEKGLIQVMDVSLQIQTLPAVGGRMLEERASALLLDQAA